MIKLFIIILIKYVSFKEGTYAESNTNVPFIISDSLITLGTEEYKIDTIFIGATKDYYTTYNNRNYLIETSINKDTIASKITIRIYDINSNGLYYRELVTD